MFSQWKKGDMGSVNSSICNCTAEIVTVVCSIPRNLPRNSLTCIRSPRLLHVFHLHDYFLYSNEDEKFQILKNVLFLRYENAAQPLFSDRINMNKYVNNTLRMLIYTCTYKKLN